MKAERRGVEMLNQISELRTANSTIPKPGREIPESEHLSIATNESQSDQLFDDKQLMCLEIALARALQQLTSKPEN
jgi:hypothetical protein